MAYCHTARFRLFQANGVLMSQHHYKQIITKIILALYRRLAESRRTGRPGETCGAIWKTSGR